MREQLQLVGVLPLPFRPPILEPDLDLGLRQLELLGQLHPLRDGQVLVLLKLRLQGLDLGGGESSAGTLLAVVGAQVGIVAWKQTKKGRF